MRRGKRGRWTGGSERRTGIPADVFDASGVTSLWHTPAPRSLSFAPLALMPPSPPPRRLYNQPVDPATGKGKYYKNWFDAFAKTAKAEGIAGVYKVRAPARGDARGRCEAKRAGRLDVCALWQRSRVAPPPSPLCLQGVGALYFRIGPHTVLTFVFWEKLRSLVMNHYA